MDTEYRLYVYGIFYSMEKKIDDIAINVNSIMTTIDVVGKIEKSQDSKSKSKWNKAGIFIASIAAVIATLAILG